MWGIKLLFSIHKKIDKFTLRGATNWINTKIKDSKVEDMKDRNGFEYILLLLSNHRLGLNEKTTPDWRTRRIYTPIVIGYT